MTDFSRRALLGMMAAAPLALAQSKDPWTDADLIYPPAVAAALKQKNTKLLHVGFPALFHGTHIPGSVFAGPGGKPEGIALLMKTVAQTPKNANIVIYCGCCPWDRCPNVRPAFSALKEKGYTNVKVLVIPENLHTDWVEKGYPVEKG